MKLKEIGTRGISPQENEYLEAEVRGKRYKVYCPYCKASEVKWYNWAMAKPEPEGRDEELLVVCRRCEKKFPSDELLFAIYGEEVK